MQCQLPRHPCIQNPLFFCIAIIIQVFINELWPMIMSKPAVFLDLDLVFGEKHIWYAVFYGINVTAVRANHFSLLNMSLQKSSMKCL